MRIITLVWVVLIATVARADNDDASRLFNEGLALQKDGKYTEACAKFTQSYDLDRKASRPAPGTQLNLGDCAERQGQLRKAYLLFDDAAHEYDRRAKTAEALLAKDQNGAEAKRDLDRATAGSRLARERATGLAPKLAKVVVRVAESGVEGLAVRIGDRAVPPSVEIIEYVDAGNLTITATAPGREPFSTSAKAESGRQVVVEIPSLKQIGREALPKPPEVAAPHRQKSRVRLAEGLGAGGLVLIGVSVVVGLAANSQYDAAAKNCTTGTTGGLMCSTHDAAEIDNAGNKADLATYLGIGGGLLAVGAVVVFFTAPKEGIALAPMASTSAAGVTVSGHF